MIYWTHKSTYEINLCRTYVQHSSYLYQHWNKPRNFYILPKDPKLYTIKLYEIYKHYKQSPTNILNDQIHYKSLTLFDTIKHSSHNNISAIPTTMNQKIAASSTGTVMHWKWCTWHRKASAKNSSKLNKFLHSEVNLLIQQIIVVIIVYISNN